VGSTVTSPKSYARLAGTRVTGRSFDDRVGCAALVLALRRLDPARLRHEVIFVFSVREEIGLEGARVVADALGVRPARVHAIDTFVSADSPNDPQAYAVAPLGAGPVIRAVDNSAVAPPALVDSLLARGQDSAAVGHYQRRERRLGLPGVGGPRCGDRVAASVRALARGGGGRTWWAGGLVGGGGALLRAGRPCVDVHNA
jgi:hypothetical protein